MMMIDLMFATVLLALSAVLFTTWIRTADTPSESAQAAANLNLEYNFENQA